MEHRGCYTYARHAREIARDRGPFMCGQGVPVKLVHFLEVLGLSEISCERVALSSVKCSEATRLARSMFPNFCYVCSRDIFTSRWLWTRIEEEEGRGGIEEEAFCAQCLVAIVASLAG